MVTAGIIVLHQLVYEVHWCSSSSAAADEVAAVMQQMQLLLLPAIHSSRPDDAACVHVWKKAPSGYLRQLLCGKDCRQQADLHRLHSASTAAALYGMCPVDCVQSALPSVTPPDYSFLIHCCT